VEPEGEIEQWSVEWGFETTFSPYDDGSWFSLLDNSNWPW
jgi:hypothetical protein